MNDQARDWRSELETWLQQNSKTMSETLRQLREDFIRCFPLEQLGSMTIEQYGKGKPDGFTYWLEYKTKDLGRIAGQNQAWPGVWWNDRDGQWDYNKTFKSPNEALTKLRDGLVTLTNEVKEGRMDNLDTLGRERLGPNKYGLRAKPLYLYFPDQFLPISKREDLRYFLTCFGEQPQGDLLALNRQLLRHLSNLPEFAGFDTQQMAKFLYDRLKSKTTTPDAAVETDMDIDNELDEDTETLSKELQQLTSLALRTRNIILYGPPGTGKTYIVQQFARRFLSKQIKTPTNAPTVEHRDSGVQTRNAHEQGVDTPVQQHSIPHYYTFVTFHQSFTYEEFVEGLKPQLKGDISTDSEPGSGQREPEQVTTSTMEYAIVPGVFRKICKRAEEDWQQYPEETPKYLLVIDEINRANIAKVFGELITLVEDDKRLGQKNELSVTLPYSGKRFGIPPNLYLLGTMNTADRSIALLDLALRRRFTFMELMPDPTLLKEKVSGVDVQALLNRLNRRIVALLDQDHQVGHSYLLNVRDVDGLRFAWYHRIIPLLQDSVDE